MVSPVTRVAFPTVVLSLGVAMLVVGAGRGSDDPASAVCPATRVDGKYVRTGPFTGAIAPEYDVLNGRFRLRVGGYRNVSTGLTQKIPWSVSRRADVGRRLRINATRLPPLWPRRFTTTLARTYSPGDRKRWFFPSIIRPPAEGCWRLRFRSGRSTGNLIVLVRD
jgi:hypothetical protein